MLVEPSPAASSDATAWLDYRVQSIILREQRADQRIRAELERQRSHQHASHFVEAGL